MRFPIIALAVLTTLAGCSRGDHSLAGENASIIEHGIARGRTTEQQALRMFGAPRSKGRNQLGEIWSYDLATSTPPSSPFSYVPLIQLMSMKSHEDEKLLVLQFDQAETLYGWSYRETDLAHYFGL